MIGLMILLSLILAYSLPMDSSVLLTNLLYRLGDEQGIFFMTLAFSLFVLLNFLIASLKRQNRFLIIMIAVFIVLLGREMLFYVVNPYMIITGFLLITTGTVVFSRQIDKIYLWF
jgi:glucan phosphoethanolaminetransferase (alkaline phosphatase superfamily)